MASFAAAYAPGDPVYIFTDIGTGVLTSVVTLDFLPGFNPAAYNAATDMIYTLAEVDALGAQIQRPEGLVFISKAEAKAYVDTLP